MDLSHLQPYALEETRRQARDNSLRLRQQMIKGEREGPHRDTGRDAKVDQEHSPHPELDD